MKDGLQTFELRIQAHEQRVRLFNHKSEKTVPIESTAVEESSGTAVGVRSTTPILT